MSNTIITPRHHIHIDEWLIEPKDLTAMGRQELLHLITELQRTLKNIKEERELEK